MLVDARRLARSNVCHCRRELTTARWTFEEYRRECDPNALVCQFPGVDRNEGADAVEVPVLINETEADVHASIAIELFSGQHRHRRRTWRRSEQCCSISANVISPRANVSLARSSCVSKCVRRDAAVGGAKGY
jgi:hypothetical protein